MSRGGVSYAPHRREASAHRVANAARRARERAVVRGFRAATALLGHVPPRASIAAAQAAFRAGYHAWPQKRRIILANASHVLGRPVDDPEVRRLARRIYAEYARFSVELMRLPTLPADEPSRIMRTDGAGGGEEFIALHERLRGEGRGMIGVSAHVGSIDVMAGAFGARGVPIYGVADDSAYPELFDLLNRQRARWGISVIPWKNLRQIFRALRTCGIVGLVVDWGYRADDVPVRLFGSPTTLPAGPAVLAAKTGAPIVPVVNRRLPDGTYRARFYEQIEVHDTSPAAIARATQAVADAIEQIIALAPDQWYTFKPIWPDDPETERQLEARRVAMLADTAPPSASRTRDVDGRGDARG